MNAHAILSYFWRSEPAAQPMKKDFPAEAYSYDDPISKEVIAAIQKEADKKLNMQQWTVIERLGDGR